MRRYEKNLLIGTVMTLIGVVLLVSIRFNFWISWLIIIAGKIIVILSVMEYVDYTRAVKGEDLNSDNQFRKIIRKVRNTRYN